MDWILSASFWLGAADRLFRIAAILIGAFILLKIFKLLVGQMFIPQVGPKAFLIDEKRARTLSSLMQSVVRYAIYFIAIVMLLQEFHIDTTSLVAGAGIIGLALGVGAQSLIKDFVTGFFIILEDQYAVGDYVTCGDSAGTVEDIGFRTTKLRDASGIVHFIPNGTIGKVTNHTRGHFQAVINIPLAYQADVEAVLALLQEVCRDFGGEADILLEEPQVAGIVDFRPGEMVVRITAKTAPLQNFKVETALRRKVILALVSAGVPLSDWQITRG